MRVLFVGNQGNTGYRFVRWLVEYGVDATLLYPENFNHPRSHPQWEDPRLEGHHPGWIQTFREYRFPYLFVNRKIRKMARSYDLILTTGFHVLPVLTLDKPVIFLPVGRDLAQMPFWSDTWINEIHSYLYRKRIPRVKRILTDQEDCIWAARLLGIGERIHRFPFLVDVRRIEQNINSGLKVQLERDYGHYDRLFFNPSRKNMDPQRVDYKGVDKLLLAYRRFLDRHENLNVLMVSGLHGLHVDAFREKVHELNLEDHMVYTGHLSLPDLHAWLSLENVAVFDQFTQNLNALSGVQREAMAMGRPVVSSTDIHAPAFQQAYGPNCPLIPAFDAHDIYRAMENITVHASRNDL
ncbi:MAG TPA: glycosyltransferase [Bacteroidales bacterium]|nr:glycosyltransferase [Bacteroidales bacterium]